MEIDGGILAEVLDKSAGRWPWDLAKGFRKVAMRCLSVGNNERGNPEIVAVIEDLEKMRREAEAHVTAQKNQGMASNIYGSNDLKDVPSGFLCPIYQV